MRVPSALTIAGSDSGGGAGIQADLKTFLALGVHGTSAICALTAQNTQGVSAVHDVPAVFVREQVLQVATDFEVAAAKTGMLSNPRIVETVADSIKEFAIPNLVVDPVFMSKNQDVLLTEDSIDALVSRLFPLATVITPNLQEAALLTGMEVADIDGMKEAARALHAMGPEWVLVKGGHLGLDATDVLYNGEIFAEVTEERIVSFNTHGTGCTLSAAIAAYLALGSSVPEAVWGAKEYVTGAIRYGLDVGQGYGPTNHGWDTTMKPGGF
ncbi:MAG TPA: bifunctional hydroxymethylpyrimidine kinase/phosphomethylpyrimidine kinase [Actinomycetota bacterium]|nr:bifunctional hydroxymethylpyrimidine kinase/phosphomethylpyrimidine kinase [Actinomycetota bacterium]